MLRKIFYFGVGLASFLFEQFDELARVGEDRYNQFVNVEEPPEEILAVETTVPAEQVPESAAGEPEASHSDDLTKIKGIGPTFANRLRDAGITTYQALAGLSVEQVQEITKVAEWQADPNDWIAAAEALA